jgi:hypothetical protein
MDVSFCCVIDLYVRDLHGTGSTFDRRRSIVAVNLPVMQYGWTLGRWTALHRDKSAEAPARRPNKDVRSAFPEDDRHVPVRSTTIGLTALPFPASSDAVQFESNIRHMPNTFVPPTAAFLLRSQYDPPCQRPPRSGDISCRSSQAVILAGEPLTCQHRNSMKYSRTRVRLARLPHDSPCQGIISHACNVHRRYELIPASSDNSNCICSHAYTACPYRSHNHVRPAQHLYTLESSWTINPESLNSRAQWLRC